MPSSGGSAVMASPTVANSTQAVSSDPGFIMPSNPGEEQQEEREVTHAVKKHTFLQTLKNWVEGTISFVDAGVKLASKWVKQAWGAISDKFPYLLAIVPAILFALFLGKDAINNSVQSNKSASNLQNNKKA
jgi:hypothetical protein